MTAEARRDVSDAIASWLPGRDDFGNQHYLALRSLTYIALYDGSVDAVAPRLEPRLGPFYAARSCVTCCCSAGRAHAHAGLALARTVEARRRGDRAAAATALRMARHDVAALARVSLPMARAATPRVRAGSPPSRATTPPPSAPARGAAPADATGPPCSAPPSACALGELVGGSEGADLTAAGQLWMASEGVRNPARMTAALLPGWRHPG